MIDKEGLAAWLRLTLIPGIGGETQRKSFTEEEALACSLENPESCEACQ